MRRKLLSFVKKIIPARAQNYWLRQDIIKYVFAILLIGFSYRIISLKDTTSFNLSAQQRAVNQSIKNKTQIAIRGDILDRNNQILASNLLLKNVNLDPSKVQIEFIQKLAKALNMPTADLSSILAKKRKLGRKYLLIKKDLSALDPIIDNLKQLKKQRLRICREKTIKIEPNLFYKALIGLKIKDATAQFKQIRKCRREKIAGVALQKSQRRYYPKSDSLSALLGRVNREKKGISGIEGEFQQVLAGENGKTQLIYSQNNRNSYFNTTMIAPLQHGENIQLTIDAKLQFYAYTALKNAVKRHQADSAAAIILASNGEILALANYPSDDPNDKTIYNAENYRNRVLSDQIEPGSTMKPFTMLLALEQNKISADENELIDVTKRIGHIKPDGKYQQMTVKQILQKSHNLGTVNIAERLSNELMYHTWKKLGFGQPLGLMPTIENSGSLRHFNFWNAADKLTLAYGYGPMNANLAQLARAYLVFANQGKVPTLKLIKNSIVNEEKTQVFSAKSTAKIADLLDSVVSQEGSGYRAVIKGYDVAGKTGTAEILVDGVYDKKGAKRTFFVGFVPTKNPKYIMAVRLDRPKKCYAAYDANIKIRCEGSNSAAMVFAETMRQILHIDTTISRHQ